MEPARGSERGGYVHASTKIERRRGSAAPAKCEKGWSLVNGKLHRAFECKDFAAAFGKMTQVALAAESMNHHPEWFNVLEQSGDRSEYPQVKGISNRISSWLPKSTKFLAASCRC